MTRVDMPADYAQLPHVKQMRDSGGVDHLCGTEDFAMSSAPVVNIDLSAFGMTPSQRWLKCGPIPNLLCA